MFTALSGHPGLYRGKKQNYGKLFTPTVIISMSVLLLIVLACAIAPLIAPYHPNAQDLGSSLALPSAEHWLGCDNNGRDIFSRILFGGRTILLSALGVVALSTVLGVPLGLLAGYVGGKVDNLIMRVCDVLLSFPSLLLALIFVAGFKSRSMIFAVIALGIVYVPMLTRLTRSLTMVERNKVYVSACVSLGYSTPRILYRHILPNCISTILVQLTLDIAYAILDLAALSFLGLGVAPPQADWGAMLAEGRQYLLQNPYLSLSPGGAIVVVVVSLNIFSDGLHQYLDPSQRALPSFKRVDRDQKRAMAALQRFSAKQAAAQSKEGAAV